jgi:hypothetical protein
MWIIVIYHILRDISMKERFVWSTGNNIKTVSRAFIFTYYTNQISFTTFIWCFCFVFGSFSNLKNMTLSCISYRCDFKTLTTCLVISAKLPQLSDFWIMERRFRYVSSFPVITIILVFWFLVMELLVAIGFKIRILIILFSLLLFLRVQHERNERNCVSYFKAEYEYFSLFLSMTSEKNNDEDLVFSVLFCYSLDWRESEFKHPPWTISNYMDKINKKSSEQMWSFCAYRLRMCSL